MKSLFRGYYKLNKEEFDSLWANAIFIFDTNVLLNLYRYQSSTRDSLLTVIERLADRVWIPYHVGLEFQRNRLKVIAAQHKRYSEVQNIVSKSITNMQTELDGLQLKKRHSHINPDRLIKSINDTKDEFIKELELLEGQSISVTSTDEIRDKIDTLFEGKVGVPPKDQKEIDELFKEAEFRYKNSIPPGFKDSNKDQNNPDEFSYGGITYKRKYGDLIVWKQLILQAEQESLKDVIFVTDDAKTDWWWIINSNGKKTISIRPELADELSRDAGVERFYAYNTEGFLRYAKKQLGADVTKEAIEEVREVSFVAQAIESLSPRHRRIQNISAEKVVFEWLQSFLPSLQENQNSYPDFINYECGNKYGYEVKLIREPKKVSSRLKEMINQSVFQLEIDDYYEITLILVVPNDHELDEIMHTLKKLMSDIKRNIKVLIGIAHINKGEFYDFSPIDEIHSNYDQ